MEITLVPETITIDVQKIISYAIAVILGFAAAYVSHLFEEPSRITRRRILASCFAGGLAAVAITAMIFGDSFILFAIAAGFLKEGFLKKLGEEIQTRFSKTEANKEISERLVDAKKDLENNDKMRAMLKEKQEKNGDDSNMLLLSALESVIDVLPDDKEDKNSDKEEYNKGE